MLKIQFNIHERTEVTSGEQLICLARSHKEYQELTAKFQQSRGTTRRGRSKKCVIVSRTAAHLRRVGRRGAGVGQRRQV